MTGQGKNPTYIYAIHYKQLAKTKKNHKHIIHPSLQKKIETEKEIEDMSIILYIVTLCINLHTIVFFFTCKGVMRVLVQLHIK